MGTPLRVLIVEDEERDAALLLRELERGGFDVTFERVDTAAAMRVALEKGVWDVILSDYSMPSFDARAALSLMREKGLDLPFIIVSGTVGEDTAVEAMRAGVHDYFVKRNLSGKLIAAIERELREASVRAERKKMQEQLLIADRMVSMGTLAAGVAHEINNPLASVMANVDLAARVLAELSGKMGPSSECDEAREELRDAREATERIRNIVRDLKIFSRSYEEKTGPVDVHRVMESTLRMAWNEIRHRARLVKRYGKIPPVEATESRLGQVFLNLLVNAAQAIAEGSAAQHEIRVSTGLDERGHVVIEVADTGPGMPPEVISRLFQPFFTTKPVGVGTGLGLSISHRIITGFGGAIEVTSRVGEGSAFRVALPPAVPGPIEEVLPAAASASPPRRGRILVIDDDPMVARALRRTLSADHEVIMASGAEEALKRLGAGETFDVILSDLMMPQMSGMELHAALVRLEHDHASRIIFLTGGAFTPRARAFLDETPNQRLEKPFDPLHLRAIISDRLR